LTSAKFKERGRKKENYGKFTSLNAQQFSKVGRNTIIHSHLKTFKSFKVTAQRHTTKAREVHSQHISLWTM
jgi:hypothetical protein